MKREFKITILFVVIQLLLRQTAFSQTVASQKQGDPKSFVFPILPKSGNTLNDFAPKGWEIIDTAGGDLNKDNLEDAALILEYQDSVVESERAIWRNTKQKTKPRILALVFKVAEHYEIKLQQNAFLFRERELLDDMNQEEQFNMDITKGVLHLNYKWKVIRGEQELNYKIRFQSKDFYLIGATYTNRGDWGSSSADFNFSTRKYVNTSTELTNSGEEQIQETKKNLSVHIIKKLSELHEAGTWKVIDGETI